MKLPIKFTVGVVIWPKFGNSGTKFDLTRKKKFFGGVALDQTNNNLKILLGMSLEFYSNLAKSNEVIQLWGLILTGRSGRKTSRGN